MLKDGKDCFYIVEDLIIDNGILSFHVDSVFYEFEFSILALSGFDEYMLVDCSALEPVTTVE